MKDLTLIFYSCLYGPFAALGQCPQIVKSCAKNGNLYVFTFAVSGSPATVYNRRIEKCDGNPMLPFSYTQPLGNSGSIYLVWVGDLNGTHNKRIIAPCPVGGCDCNAGSFAILYFNLLYNNGSKIRKK